MHDMHVVTHVRNGGRPDRLMCWPTVFTEPMWQLLENCWDEVPANRLDMGSIVHHLEHMQWLTVLPLILYFCLFSLVASSLEWMFLWWPIAIFVHYVYCYVSLCFPIDTVYLFIPACGYAFFVFWVLFVVFTSCLEWCYPLLCWSTMCTALQSWFTSL